MDSKKIIHPLNIGGVTLPNNIILAPMAGVSDLPFRVICSEMGAGMCCMEMVSAKAIHYKNKGTWELMEISPKEGIVSLQLFGSDPECMAEAAGTISDLPNQILDINMGCPVPKVVKNGDGSALMKDPILAGKVIESVVAAAKKPVTVKIRSGFDADHINAPELAHIAQESGAAAVAVHGRTRDQMYMGRADWSVIAKVKDSVSIPVIGNGDIRCPKDVSNMYEATGCDGFMIGRGAQGNPWLFSSIPAYFECGVECPKPDINIVCDMIIRHAEMEVETKGEYIAIREMRKHAAWYTGGYPGSSKLRRSLNTIGTLEELRELLSFK